MEDFNKQTNNEYAPNVHSNYIDCDLKDCINPTFTYSIQEKYDNALYEQIQRNAGKWDYLKDDDCRSRKDMVSQIIKIVNLLHEKKYFIEILNMKTFLSTKYYKINKIKTNKNKKTKKN